MRQSILDLKTYQLIGFPLYKVDRARVNTV